MNKEKNLTPIKASKTRKRVRFSDKPTYIDEAFDEHKHLRGDENDTYPEEYVIDHILTHGYAEDVTPYYKVKWYGYTESTWEPTRNTPRSHIVRYWHRIGEQPPLDLSQVQVG